MIRRIEAEFWFGDIVYLKVADDPDRGMVTSVHLYPTGDPTYRVQWNGGLGDYHDFELTREFVPQYPKQEEST